MAIQIATQRTALASAYASAAPYGTLFSGTPATTGAATNELSGGSFARLAAGWAAAANSATTSSAMAFAIPSGSTVAYFGVTVSSTLATADVRDTVAVTSQTFSSAGTYTVTATYTQS